MDAIQQHVATLLERIAHWNEMMLQARSCHQELAPDFSLVDWLKNDELALSRYLRFLLSPDETHGQAALFLKTFISLIKMREYYSPVVAGDSDYNVRVDCEVTVENGRKIDLLLTFLDGVIAIENKPWAADQENQLRDYALWLNKRERPWTLIYLCNHEPSELSLPEHTPEVLKKNIVTISWYEVVEWLNTCLCDVKAAAVRIFVESLVKYIQKSVNGEFIMDNSRELSEIIRKDNRSIESAFMIFNQMNEVRDSLLNEFILALNDSFKDYPFVVQYYNQSSLKYGTNFYIRFYPSSYFSLCWEFGRSNYSDLYFGISDESLGADADRTEKISTAMSALFSASQGKISKHWSWWSWDLDPQGRNRIPRNWSNDGAVWIKLRERGEGSIFETIREVILTVYQKMDLDLLR